MGLFSRKKKNEVKKGFFKATVSAINKETADTVSVSIDLDEKDKHHFNFTPGQYLTFIVTIDGKEHRRSYSICSHKNEPLTIAVKKLSNGTISKYFNNEVEVGTELIVSAPEGNFKLDPSHKNIVLFAAGSGITPILSMAKSFKGDKARLYYGSKTEQSIIFKNTLDKLSDNISIFHYLSQEEKDNYGKGRLNDDNLSDLIKADLDILKADAFYICGPEEMIVAVAENLKTFGVADDKVNYELFTTPTLLASNETQAVSNFEGLSKVTAVIDDEEHQFELNTSGKTILDELEAEAIDAPYSCRGGVCCTCKAKVIEGSAVMDMNYSLTDAEVADGYILTCQAHPTSPTLKISYDD